MKPWPPLNPARWSWRALLVAGFVVYGIAAFRSEGVNQLDEHFQVLEFANYKLGGTPGADLPWEFQHEIRPTLQADIAVAVIRGLRAVGVASPFTQVFVLRLLSGWLAILVFAALSRKAARGFASEATGRVLFAAAVFLWFMPYMSVRFSSENWSALAFLAGVALLPLSAADDPVPPSRYALAGLLLGLSFEFRFQLGFALAGLAAWIIVQRKWPRAGVLALVAGGAIALAFGTGLDTWFYGHGVFAPWRYLHAYLTGVNATEFGVSPWWQYLPTFLFGAGPPISIVLLVLGGIGAYQMRAHPITWAFAAFLLAHIVIGHKEFRFLFPMTFPLLWLAAAGWQRWRASGAWRRLGGVALWMGLPVNIGALIAVCTLPALQLVPAWRFLYNASRTAPVTLFAVRSPYDMWQLKPHFFNAPNLVVQTVPQVDSLAGPRVGDLILARRLVPVPVVPGFTVEPVFRAYPDWLLRLDIGGWEQRTEIWSIYRVRGLN